MAACLWKHSFPSFTENGYPSSSFVLKPKSVATTHACCLFFGKFKIGTFTMCDTEKERALLFNFRERSILDSITLTVANERD